MVGGYGRSQLTLLKHGCLLICSLNPTEKEQEEKGGERRKYKRERRGGAGIEGEDRECGGLERKE